MARELAIRCACGILQGVAREVGPHAGCHVVCYCDDCKSFARFLGRVEDVLDAQGGTELFQMSPANLVITAGKDQLACMRLTSRGLLRWYARCCNTPIGNTLSTSKWPFVGLIHACIRKPEKAISLDVALGPILVRGFRQSATGNGAVIPANQIPIPVYVLRFATLMLRWRLRGDRKRSVFFASDRGLPVSHTY
jgi:hypothetical protein